MKPFTTILVMMLAAVPALAAEREPAVTTGAPLQDGHRYLFLLDASATMARNKENTEKTVRDLVASGMNGEFNLGDAFAIWPYRDKVVTDAFVPETWAPQLKDTLANAAGQFVSGIRYQGSSLYYVALVEGFKVLRASKAATLILISDGTEMMQGTPFDVYANSIYRDHASQLRKEKKPFVTVLVAVEGKIIGCTVGSGGDPITLPPIPEGTKKWLAAEFAASRVARKPVILAADPPKTVPAPKLAPENIPITKKVTPITGPEPTLQPVTPAPAPMPIPPRAQPVAAGINPVPLPAQLLPPSAPAPAPAVQAALAPVSTVELPTQQAEQRPRAVPEPIASAIPARSPRETTPTSTSEREPDQSQLGVVTPGATQGRTRMLLIGLGLLTAAVLIGWLMFRGNRGPKRPSLISRSMGK